MFEVVSQLLSYQRVRLCANLLWFDLERVTLACREQIATLPSMRADSQDLRERIVQALQAQEGSQAEVAERFAVSRSFVEKLWRRWRTTGQCAALPHAGGRQRSLRAVETVLRHEVARQPDCTLAELCERVVQAGGTQVSAKTMCTETLTSQTQDRRRTPSKPHL